MKLKYYLRGLGIGMVVTALLMGFATKDNGIMSDEEVKARAAELGMVEQRTLADIRDNAAPTEEPAATPVPTEKPVVTEAPTQEPEATEVPDVTQTPAATDTPTKAPAVTEEPVQTPEVTEAPQETPEIPVATEVPVQTPDTSQEPQETDPTVETTAPVSEPTVEILEDRVRITIYAGNHSLSVSRVLEEVSLVANAEEFDRYLQENGYSKIVNSGTHEIKIGTPEDEIARIITRTN